jgi:ActR/RegA family two-component response regulator
MATLLLVDDNSAFLRMYGKILELIGFDTALAGGEAEFIHTLQAVTAGSGPA